MIYRKIKGMIKKDRRFRDSMPETPPWMERTLTTMPQPYAWGRGVIIYHVIDNNDSGTFRPAAIMFVGKAEINTSGSFRFSRQYWGNSLYGLRFEIIHSPPATNNSLKRNLCYWSNCLGLNGHSKEFRLRCLRWQELINANYEQISRVQSKCWP